MLLHALELRNFGPFAGTHRLDLRPRSPDRPIVLIGGGNGTGKTSILEALRLCLWGDRAHDRSWTAEEYAVHLRRCLHRPPDGPAASCGGVTVEFEHTRGAMTRVYAVRRDWTAHSRGVREELSVTCDGQVLEGANARSWPRFARDLVPDGLDAAMLFDGERLQAFASDDGAAFARAARALFGLTALDRARDALRTHARREAARAPDELGGAWDGLQAERDRLALRERRSGDRAARARRQAAIDRAAVRDLEARLMREGRDVQALERERDALQVALEAAEADVRERAGGLAPIGLLADLARLAAGRLEAPAPLGEEARSVLEDVLAQLEDHAWWPDDGTNEAREAVARRLRDHFAPRLRGHGDFFGSDAERARHARRLRDALAEGRAWRAAARELLDLRTAWANVTAELARPDDNEGLEGVRRTLAEARAAVAASEKVLAEAEAEVTAVRDADRRARRALEQLQVRLKQRDARTDCLALAAASLDALTDFAAALQKERATALAAALRECLGALLNKAGAIHDVAVDADTLAIRVLGHADAPSAGERHLQAVAQLWALSRVAKQGCPLVLDTPLARLDMVHRGAIVQRWWPQASVQLIVLTTDTEVDAVALNSVIGSVSHSQRLEFDPIRGSSHGFVGYIDLDGVPSDQR
ncbi:DNA sulfur modification protein DndD [Deinococcus yavapaiensis]|uniref:DNA sulfur modification protein DndD n=1 Tax=Deinococcus yavapaiensis KR-236 TaxID=694435 RepID=A0A318SCE6_9DEIO|nr:DNA sulfur modification protein DndD [Deinococcus yavapaiensis]PYE54088.1 DNA sulfur modification protein DndD [Deinococcus yavapaiensis KR-236]